MTTITASLSLRHAVITEDISNNAVKALGNTFLDGGVIILHSSKHANIFHECSTFILDQQEKESNPLIAKEIAVMCVDVGNDSNDLQRQSKLISGRVKMTKCDCFVEKNFQKFWRELVLI